MLEPLNGVRLKIDNTQLNNVINARTQYDNIFQQEYDSLGRPELNPRLLNELETLALQKQMIINNYQTYTPEIKYLKGWC